MIKTIILIFGLSGACLASTSDSLLELAKQHDIKRYEFALEKGTRIVPTTDGRSFYLLWKPDGFDSLKQRPIIATIHGHGGFAFDEFFMWYKHCKERGYAIIALQWYFGGDESSSNYYQPNEMYPIFEKILRDENIKQGECLFHGFSRGAANTYGIAAFDRHTGNNFFGLIIANAGSAEDDYPINIDITKGKFGAMPYSGTNWVLYCGMNDNDNPTRSGCNPMEKTVNWITSLGGTVRLFIKDEKGGHGGFHMNKQNTIDALDIFSRILGK